MTYRGVVAEGNRKAGELGFPTINIPLDDADPSGIYAARVTIEGKEYGAAAYANQRRNLLEAHLLDFSGDLYGKEVSITLVKKLRDDEWFETEEELREAIAADVIAVRSALSS